MVDYGQAIKLPFSDGKKFWINMAVWIGYFVVSLLLNLLMIPLIRLSLWWQLPFGLVYVAILAMPLLYYTNLGIKSSKGDFTMPSWHDSSSFKEMMELALVTIVWSIPAIILIMAVVFGTLGTGTMQQFTTLSTATQAEKMSPVYALQAQQMILPILPKLLYLIPLLLIISFFNYLVYLSAQLKYSQNRKLSEAFDVGSVLSTAFTRNMAGAVFLSSLIIFGFAIVSMVAFFILAITLVGIVLIPFLVGIMMNVFMAIFYSAAGQAYGEVNKVKAVSVKKKR
jgi:hypothetical protein